MEAVLEMIGNLYAQQNMRVAQLVGTVEYTNCISTEG